MPSVARIFFHRLILIVLFGLLAAQTPFAQETSQNGGDSSVEEPADVASGDAESGDAESGETESGETGDAAVLAPEASAYLMDLKIGDAGVDLTWDGYWRMTFTAGGGFGQVSEETAFDGLSTGVTFFQEPDLTLTLWLNNRWFVETTFLEGFERNTYRAGYMGDGFVREVVAGNAGVNATSYAGIDVPAPVYNTPGIVGKFATESSDHQILLRYDPTESGSKTFRGQYEVTTRDIGLPEFAEGRYFILPDTGVSNVRVFLEDSSGTVSGTDQLGSGVTRKYREAEAVEFFADETGGFVVLSEESDGQVLVYYDVGGTAVGDAALGRDFIVPANAFFHPDFDAWGGSTANLLDFNWTVIDAYDPAGRNYGTTSGVTLPIGDALILYDPDRFTPFERQNVYESSSNLPEDTWRIVPLIEDRGALYPSASPDYEFDPDSDDDTITVYGDAVSADGLRDPANRYPFASDDPDVYGPGRETDSDKLSRIIVLAIRNSSPGYSLGSGVVSGSVVIRVNGVRDSTAEVTDDGGIEFSRYIYPDDWIEVAYRTETLDLEGGDLYIYQGNRFELSPSLTWELAESVRWNLSGERSSEEYGESPGEIKLATVLDWQTDRAVLSLTGDVALSTPDTVGNLRLFGMDDGGMEMVFYQDTLVAAPDTGIPSEPGGTRTDADRYDYTSSGSWGSEILNSYLWSGATSTGEDGPALADNVSGDPTDGYVMEMRFDTADTEWTAADFLASSDGPMDLSGYTALEFPIKFIDDHGSSGLGAAMPKIVLQAGEIGESEDHHDDGTINAYDPGSMLEWDFSDTLGEGDAEVLAAWSAPGTWETVTLSLSAAQQAYLDSVRSFRIILENDTGSAVSGRVILGAPLLAGSPFRTEIRDVSDDLTANQSISGDEADADDLLSAYSETEELFHSDGDSNKAMRIRWGDEADGGPPGGSTIAATDRWEAVSWFSGVPLESYRTLVFYVKSDSAAYPVTARLTDSEDRGVSVTWTPAVADTWDRITVDIADAAADSANGAAIADVSVDGETDEVSRFYIAGVDSSGASSGDPSGTVYVDEVYLTDPAYAVTGGAELQGSWNHPEDIAVIGRFPVLGNITLDGSASVSGGTVISGLESGSTNVTGTVGIGADVMGVGLQTDWSTTWESGTTNWSGSHTLRIPARGDVFWMEESYARAVSSGEATFSRGNSVNLAFRPGDIGVFADAVSDGDTLVQTWGGDTAWKGSHWNLGLGVGYVLSSDDPPTAEENYFAGWTGDYAYLAPVDSDVTGRGADHALEAGLFWDAISLDWNPALGFDAALSPAWVQANTWSGTLSLPLKFRTWSLSASYSRDLSLEVDISDGRSGGYGDAWNVFGDAFQGQLPLITYVPFRELFAEDDGEIFAAKTEGMEEADYAAVFSLGAARNTESGFWDLLVPANGDLSIQRTYRREDDTSGWEDEWRGSLGFTALNLFGRFGLYSMLPWYNSEEIISLIQLTLEDYNGTGVPDPEELLCQTNWTFNGRKNRKLTLDYRISWMWDSDLRETDQEGSIQFSWRTPSRDVLHLPLVRRAIPRSHYLENTERFSVTGRHPWSDAPSGSYADYGFMVRHETGWVFPDMGHFKGWLAIGLGESDAVFTNGWELGLEAEFRF